MGEELLLRYGWYQEREAIVAHVMESADRYWGDVLFLIQDLRTTCKIHRKVGKELIADVGRRHPIIVHWFKNNGFDVRIHEETGRMLVYFPPRTSLLPIQEITK